MEVRSQMRRAAHFYADREAFVHGDRRLTFAESWSRGLRFANALLGYGLGPSDRVAVLENNGLHAADFFVGTVAANLVRVPLYARNSRETHVAMLRRARCRVLVVSEEFAEVVADIDKDVPSLERVLVRDRGNEDLLAAHPDEDPDVPVSSEDVITIRFTGGTTGEPKGVVLTHRAWLALGRDGFYLYPPVQVGDRLLHVGPISHASGNFVVPIWLSGGTKVMLEQFSSEGALDLMERERIAYIFAVPTMLAEWMRSSTAAERDWSALKVLHIGGAPIAEETVLRARAIFGDVIYNAYGMTEAVQAAMMGPQDYFATVDGSQPLRSVGKAHPYAEIEIRDEDGRPLPFGAEGEIAIRCEGSMSGYWDNEVATAKTLVDGWVLSGDIGRIDRNGYLYLLDRKEDMIISGGFNIYPADLERVLESHPAVVEAAVFGIPHAKWGETPMAVVAIEAHAIGTVDETELIQLCAEKLGAYRKPAGVEIGTEPLPRSPVGKVHRRVLREPHWARRDEQIAGV